MHLSELTSGLRLDPEGYWIAGGSNDVSYPDTGNDFCLSVEDHSFWFAHRNRAILAAVRHYPPAGGPILDVGAGNGFVTAALAGGGWPAIAIEPSRRGARNAVARGVTDVVCGALPSPSFREASAGGIGLFDVIEHVPDDRYYLASLRPYLAKGGRIYITTPAYSALWSDDDVAAGHHRRYSVPSLRDTLTKAGLEVEYAGYFFWWLPAVTFFARTLRSKVRRKPFVASTAEHTAGSVRLRRLLERTFAFETRLISRGRRLPFGASCLAVARSG